MQHHVYSNRMNTNTRQNKPLTFWHQIKFICILFAILEDWRNSWKLMWVNIGLRKMHAHLLETMRKSFDKLSLNPNKNERSDFLYTKNASKNISSKCLASLYNEKTLLRIFTLSVFIVCWWISWKKKRY